ncbi:MAG: flippase [Candidatus Promineifilaceae bacterium]
MNEPAPPAEGDVARLAAGAGIAMTGKLSSRALFAASQIVLARVLGPAAFGVYALAWAILRLLGAFTSLGLDRGVIWFAAPFWSCKDRPGLNSVLNRATVLAVAGGMALAGLLILASPGLERLFDEPGLGSILGWFALALPLFGLLRVLAAATRLTQRVHYSILAEELALAAANLVIIFLLVLALGRGLAGASLAVPLSFLFASLLAGFYVVRLFPGAGRPAAQPAVSIRSLLAYSLPTAVAGVFTTATTWTDRLFLGLFLSANEVGIYQAVTQVSLLFAIALQAVNAIFAPMIADLYHRQQMTRLNELYKISTKWGVYASIPVFLTIAFVPAQLLEVIFGAAYTGGTLPLRILAVAQLFNVASGAVGFLLIMTGRERFWLRLTGLALGLNLALNWLLVQRAGLVGAAIASGVTTTFLYSAALLGLRRQLGLWPYDRRYLKGLAAGLAATGAIWLFLRLAPAEPAIRAFGAAGTAGLVFAAGLLLLGLEDEDRAFVQLLRRPLRQEAGHAG